MDGLLTSLHDFFKGYLYYTHYFSSVVSGYVVLGSIVPSSELEQWMD